MEKIKPEEPVIGWTLVVLLLLAICLLTLFSPRPVVERDWSGHQAVIEHWMEEAKR